MMKRVTRDIDPDRARDLLERAPRACVCFACDHAPQALPITLVMQSGRYLAGASQGAERAPRLGQEVVLLIDEGVRFFDLRAISIRGRVAAAAAPTDAPAGRTWKGRRTRRSRAAP
jgi:hypothetical protein